MIAFLIFTLLLAVLTHCTEEELHSCDDCSCNTIGYNKWIINRTLKPGPNECLKYDSWLFNCDTCWYKNHNQTELGAKNSLLRFNVTLNEFAIMLDEEFLDFMTNNNIDLVKNRQECRTDIPPINGEIPDSINWKEKGAVTSVKAQENCISDWAFSAAGVMEAHRVIKFNKTMKTLSAQNLIDCSKKFGNDGCYGGDVINAFKYVQAYGINTDSAYPYVAKGPNECLFVKNNSLGNLAQEYRCVAEGDENQLKAVVANYGPVVVSVDARRWDFRFYHSGIYYDDNCCYHKRCLNHAMLLVGYGSEEGVDYWLLKNSWGKSWGEQGYIRIARNLNNTCGVATAALYLV